VSSVLKQLSVGLFTKREGITTQSLRRWNFGLAGLYFVQAVAILLLGTNVARVFPVMATFLASDSLQTKIAGHNVLAQAGRQLFTVNLSYLIVTFFLLSVISHLLLGTIYRKRYERDLKRGVNTLRWIEYALSLSTMTVVVGFISGIYDLPTLVMLFALMTVLNLFGLTAETRDIDLKKSPWVSYVVACIAGGLPWLVLAFYLFGAFVYGDGRVAAFVYWVYGSMFILFVGFVINTYLRNSRYGKWADYMHVERLYMVLSLTAKTLLAWLVFAGLRP